MTITKNDIDNIFVIFMTLTNKVSNLCQGRKKTYHKPYFVHREKKTFDIDIILTLLSEA